MNVFLSAIVVVDDLPCLDYLPWRESMASALKFSDELIVVHGGKTQPNGRSIVKDYVEGLRDPRIRWMPFPWPSTFDWRQIARTCTFGHLHARGQWCFRVLADEVFPDDFSGIRQKLEAQPDDIKIVSVDRLYLLGNQYACPLHGKPLFFRNDHSVGYGTVNPAQGEAASYLLFDDPLETDHWFDGREVVSIQDRSILRDPNGLERLHRGDTPYGYRGESTHRMTRTLPMGILNVDVNHYPDDALLDQKDLSQQGYSRLPAEYPHRRILSRTELGLAIRKKVGGMIRTGKLMRVQIPEGLHAFIDRQEGTVNCVRRLCEYECGFSWNRQSVRASKWRRGLTLGRNAVGNVVDRLRS